MSLINRRRWLLLPCAGALGSVGCAWLPRAAVVPMPVIRLPADAQRRADVLVVMLPGAYSLPREFVEQGFVARLQQRYAVDVAIADAHLGYAENGTLLERVRDDVLLPAQRAGYRRIWLVGISLGGFTSLGLLMRQPEAIEGVLAIAPYVGPPALLQQVSAAGGATAYAAAPHRDDDLQAELWVWLGRSSPALRDKIHLYTGSDDRLITGQRLLEALLAADHVLEVPGDHDWPAWNALWTRWLTHAPWPVA
ncbi:MAG TPA: alpha/beta hydrolase-fold protein [Burkholderiaceae bacterium]|nr:alpha/beta hydrolase-fold protein [Burkholderiaceae bacterium]